MFKYSHNGKGMVLWKNAFQSGNRQGKKQQNTA